MKIDCKFPWRTQPLSQIITDTISGVSLGDNDFADNGFPVAHKGDVRTNGILDLSPRNSRYVTGKSFELNKRAQVTNEYLVVSLRDLVPAAPQLGLINKLPEDQSCVLLAQGTYGFKVDPKQLDMTFLSQLSSADFFRSTMKKNAVGSTQKHLRSTEFFELEVPVPPIDEQEKIAKILSTWDEAIKKLESHFSMRSRLHAHQIENIYLQIQKTGKETDLRSVCSQIQDGTHSTPDYTTEGVPFYSVETLVSNNFNDTKYISKEDHEINIKRCRPEKGDLLLTRIGSLGVSKLIDWDVDASIYVSLALIKPNHDLIDSGYLYFYFQTKKFNKELLKRSLLNAAPQKINLSEIGNIPIYLPKDEATQKAAGRYVKGLKSELELLKKKIDRLKHQKQGLMQQLLTGKRRVKV